MSSLREMCRAVGTPSTPVLPATACAPLHRRAWPSRPVSRLTSYRLPHPRLPVFLLFGISYRRLASLSPYATLPAVLSADFSRHFIADFQSRISAQKISFLLPKLSYLVPGHIYGHHRIPSTVDRLQNCVFYVVIFAKRGL